MKNRITLTLTASALTLLFFSVASLAADDTKPKKEGKTVGASDWNSARSNQSTEIDKSEEDGIVVYAENWNSARSNTAQSIKKGKSGYAYSLNFGFLSKAEAISAQEYEALVDAALADMKRDLMGNYQNVAVGLEKHQAQTNKPKAR